MEITLNGIEESRPSSETVAQLVDSLGLSGSPCAVEINERLVPRSELETTVIRDGDKVEIVTLVGGG